MTITVEKENTVADPLVIAGKSFDSRLLMGTGRYPSHEHMRRCKESGYRTLILTVDCQTAGNRERDFYNGFSFPLKRTPRRMLDGILHPSWTWDYLFSPKYSFPNIEGSVIGEDEDMSEVIQWFGQQLDDSFTWDDAE